MRGIGARNTPKHVLENMEKLASLLNSQGYTLRSGGADGADSAFEKGSSIDQKEIFLPWKNFRKNTSTYFDYPDKATEIAEQFHPRWSRLNNTARLYMIRNSCQILGYTLDSPCDFVVCYTENGSLKGGTAQAMRIAIDRKIPILNYGSNSHEDIVDMLYNRGFL